MEIDREWVRNWCQKIDDELEKKKLETRKKMIARFGYSFEYIGAENGVMKVEVFDPDGIYRKKHEGSNGDGAIA